VKKLFVDNTGKVAWTFSGGWFSDVTAHYLRDCLDENPARDELSIESAIKKSGNRATEAFHTLLRPYSTDILVLVFGSSRQMLRAQISREGTVVTQLETKQCVSGATDSLVNFFPNHFCSAGDMSVDQLAPIAAYCVRMAHEEDSKYVDGLDIAIFRDLTGRFEFADRDLYWDEAGKLDDALRQFVRAQH